MIERPVCSFLAAATVELRRSVPGLSGEGEGVPVAFQNGAAYEHVHDLCAHVRSESPKTLCLTDGQAETRHFLKLGADTDDKVLDIHLGDVFPSVDSGD